MGAVTVLVAPDGHVQAAALGSARAAEIGRLREAMAAAGMTGWTVAEMDAMHALRRLAEDCPACRMPCGCSADDKLERRCPHRLRDSAAGADRYE